ncbi:bifunctional oligoribonuclease/PAP phosphatase NrnA [Candidatus Babeliales bacterium]|nr:bifunctional oligoribonuclease/PAP phosphatase NrnA [Candidatus Babeliales bacterium]
MNQYLKNDLFSPHLVTDAWHLIESVNAITLLTHQKPDADGMSACAAMSALLEKMGKSVEVVYPSEPEVPLKRQGANVLVNKHKQEPDLLIMFDTANYERLYYPAAFHEIPSINIDHHISNSIKASINLITDQVSSTCEQLYLLLHWWGQEVDKYMAECLLFGMLYDCQVFHTQSTRPRTLRVAADLIDAGANLFELMGELLFNKKPEIITLWGRLLSSVTFAPNRKAAWSVIRQKDLQSLGLTLSSTVGFSNFLAQLSDIDITILFYEEQDGKTKVSLRSKQADVNKLAGHFGGGGHKNASGISLNRPIDEVVKEVTSYLQ